MSDRRPVSPSATWPLWEVFVRGKRGLSHVHVGLAARPRRRDGAAQRPRRLHPPPGGRLDLGRAGRRHHRVAARTRRTRSSTRRPTRSTATRRSTTSPRMSSTCDRPLSTTSVVAHLRAAARRRRAGLRAAAGRVDQPRPAARGGHRARQHRPRPARPGPRAADATPASSRAPAATRTTWPTCATSASSATSTSSSSRAATSASTMARLLLFSTYQRELYAALRGLAPTRSLAGVAGKAVKEVDYHRDHATQWVLRLGDGTEESHAPDAGGARRGVALRRRALRRRRRRRGGCRRPAPAVLPVDACGRRCVDLGRAVSSTRRR